jgi:YidC/Oxa1 family membrane protein insertase
MDNNRNLFITIILSVVILAAWQIFYIGPKIEAEKQAQIEQQAAQPDDTASQTPAATTPGADTSVPQTATDDASVASDVSDTADDAGRISIETLKARASTI